MPWYLIAAMLAPSLIVAVGLTYVSLRLAYRIGALETSQDDMMEGAIRRDAAAVQVGRILGLRSAKATACKAHDRELRLAAYCRQENGDDKEALEHEQAARVMSDLCDRLQEDLYLAGDKDECGQACKDNAVSERKNVVNICDYCTDDKGKPRLKQ